MIGFKAFVIYDTLFEEYQVPFFLKNENVAKMQFDMFVRDMVEKAPEQEKAKTRTRFFLYSFDLSYDKDEGTFFSIGDNSRPTIKISPEPVAQGGESDV